MAPSLSQLLLLLLLGGMALPGGHAFFPNFWSKFLSFTWGSYTHQDMTEEAVLNITLQILLDNPHTNGQALRRQDFQGKTLIADDILVAYFGEEVSLRQFRDSLRQIVSSNANMDFLSGTRSDPIYHFDSENLMQGNRQLLDTRNKLLSSVKAEDYGGARERLGQILHSLQDFYSHTNWVELGHTDIHPDLATPGREISFIAGALDQTCTDCNDLSCHNNLAETIQKRHLLTSGYYGESPEKPHGKCSHGGPFDDSSQLSARGGINKDTSTALFSPHHFLHHKAATLALEASIKFLGELRKEISDGEMLRLLGVCGSSALSFVIDTTGSMGEEITTARQQSIHIIESRKQTQLCLDYYILVPFHDPAFGPVYKTTNPTEFLSYLNNLVALGGGDEPEMCLSALQLALIHTPPYSEIFVFTDASSKDQELRSSVEALIQERKTKVSFLITEDTFRMKSRSKRQVLKADRFDIYSDLALTSGGQVIFTSDHDINAVSEIIADSAHSDMLTLFNLQSSERGEKNHTFQVDEFIHNVSLYINGDVNKFIIWDPAGLVQYGHRHTNGKFIRVSLSDPLIAGQWSILTSTSGPHTLRAQGRSSVDFLYYFGVPVHGTHPGLLKLNNQPVAGVPAILVVDVIGLSDSAHLDHVTLTPAQGDPLTVKLESANQTGLLVAQVNQIPDGGFSIGVSGKDENGSPLIREAPQRSTPVECIVEMIHESPLNPNITQTLLLRINNYAESGCYTIALSNDRSFPIISDISRINLNSNETHEAQFKIQVPANANSDSVVSLMAQATSCEENRPSCFALLPLIITKKNEDIPLTPRVSSYHSNICSRLTYNGSCPISLPVSVCQDYTWSSRLVVSDPYGVKTAKVLSSSGVVSHRPDGTSEWVEYKSDCCSTTAQIELTNHRGDTRLCKLHAPTHNFAFSFVSKLEHIGSWVLFLGIICILSTQ